MVPDPHNLIWLDLEMSGLDPAIDRILEIAVVVTDNTLNLLAVGPVLAIYQSPTCLEAMNSWCQQTHRSNGLIARVQQSTIDEAAAEQQVVSWLQQWVSAGCSPLCGNSVWQDKQFLQRYMPTLASYCHYRCIDVSTLKELAKRWNPTLLTEFQKRNTHRALDDILESIAELNYYRHCFLQL